MSHTLTTRGRHKVVIYGTLKRGEPNHNVLRNAEFLGEDRLTCVALYDLGDWPGARLEPSDGIEVEVYAVTLSQLARLDEFEDYRPHAPGTSLYVRRTVRTCFGHAWVYLYNRGVQAARRITRGAWSSRPEGLRGIR